MAKNVEKLINDLFIKGNIDKSIYGKKTLPELQAEQIRIVQSTQNFLRENNAGFLMKEITRLLPQFDDEAPPLVTELRQTDILASYPDKMTGTRYKYAIENLIEDEPSLLDFKRKAFLEEKGLITKLKSNTQAKALHQMERPIQYRKDISHVAEGKGRK